MKAIKYVFAKDVKELEGLQAKAVRSVQASRVAIQIAAVATIKHAYDHGDWTYAQTLVTALGNTINGKALVEWFVQYGGLAVDDTGFIGWKGKDHIKEKFEAAKSTMWWDLKVQSPFKGFSLEDALKQVIKQHTAAKAKMDKLDEADKEKVSFTVNDETIKAVLSLCNFEAILGEEEEQAA